MRRDIDEEILGTPDMTFSPKKQPRGIQPETPRQHCYSENP
jgi:hypothetical protein